MCAIFLGTLVLHMLFGKTGWLFRYEAYLVAMGWIVAGVTLLAPVFERLRQGRLLAGETIAYAFAALLLLWPAAARGNEALRVTSRASTNVYEQQYQMGRFLAEHYPQGRVAANDVGAITFLTNIDLLDFYGLFSVEVLREKRTGTINTAYFARRAEERGVEIAIVYEALYQSAGGIPASWIKAGEWKVSNNVVLWADVVAFYAGKTGVGGQTEGEPATVFIAFAENH